MNNITKAMAVLTIAIMTMCTISIASEVSADDGTDGTVDTSAYAGDYWAEKNDGTWFRAITIDDNGNGTAYKAYPTDDDTDENFVITSVTDNGDTVTMDAYRPEKNNIEMLLTYYEIPGKVMYGTLQCNHSSLVGTDVEGQKIHGFTRAAPEGEEWFGYTATEGPGFTPYYLTDAVELGMGDVTISLPSGTYSLTYNQVDFYGDSITIKAEDGADVEMTSFSFTGRNSPSLTVEGIVFTNEDTENIKFMDVANLTVRDCTVYDRLLTSGKNSITPGSAVIEGCTFINERITDDLHVATVCSDNIVFKDNRIEGYPRGVNMQGTGSGEGSFSATGNTFVDLFSPGQGAIQFADGIDGVSLDVEDNTVEGCQALLAIHDGCTGTPGPVNVTGNKVSDTTVGILYKSDSEGGVASQVTVEADGNLFIGPDGDGERMPVATDGDADVSDLVTCDEWYTDADMDGTNLDPELPPFIPFPDDGKGDPVEVGPIDQGGPSSSDDGDDTLKVVAVAAAAVIAAILVIVLASTYRHD